MTVQRFNASTGYGHVSMLEPAAMALFRYDATPTEVFDYVMSENFASNRAVTEAIFESWLSGMVDLSASANTLISRASDAHDTSGMELPLTLLVSVLNEALARGRRGQEVRCKINRITPLVDLVRGIIRIGEDPARTAMTRFRALESLQNLGEPELWKAVSRQNGELIEEMIDHLALLERSREKTLAARQRIHSDGPAILQMEAKYLLEVFKLRGAMLTPTHASLYWACLRDLRERMKNANRPVASMERTYRQIQLLLEHQLKALGLERDASLDRSSRSFVEPRMGIVIRIRNLIPEILVFRDQYTHEPLAVFDAWNDLYVFLERARGR